MAGAAAVAGAVVATLALDGAGAEVEGATGVLSVMMAFAFALAWAFVLALAGRLVGRWDEEGKEGGSGVGLSMRARAAAVAEADDEEGRGRDDRAGGSEGSERRDPVRESIWLVTCILLVSPRLLSVA